jgi:PncC family amidohydrolase
VHGQTAAFSHLPLGQSLSYQHLPVGGNGTQSLPGRHIEPLGHERLSWQQPLLGASGPMSFGASKSLSGLATASVAPVSATVASPTASVAPASVSASIGGSSLPIASVPAIASVPVTASSLASARPPEPLTALSQPASAAAISKKMIENRNITSSKVLKASSRTESLAPGHAGPVQFARMPASVDNLHQTTAAAAAALAALQDRHATLAVAESCTGGLIGHALTEVPGASRAFRGSAVVYANDAKRDLLGVAEADLAAYGAVSEPVALAMAVGARRQYGSDVAVATSGIAGPDGGTAQKPVGTLCLAISAADEARAWTVQLPGLSRGDFKHAAARAALAAVREWAAKR